jgi:hypothetical protein
MIRAELRSMHDLFLVYKALAEADVDLVPGQGWQHTGPAIMKEEVFSSWVIDTATRLWFSGAAMYTERYMIFRRTPSGSVMVEPQTKWELVLQ